MAAHRAGARAAYYEVAAAEAALRAGAAPGPTRPAATRSCSCGPGDVALRPTAAGRARRLAVVRLGAAASGDPPAARVHPVEPALLGVLADLAREATSSGETRLYLDYLKKGSGPHRRSSTSSPPIRSADGWRRAPRTNRPRRFADGLSRHERRSSTSGPSSASAATTPHAPAPAAAPDGGAPGRHPARVPRGHRPFGQPSAGARRFATRGAAPDRPRPGCTLADEHGERSRRRDAAGRAWLGTRTPESPVS